jgi:uncharacterized protein YsxB (DUF464 family)
MTKVTVGYRDSIVSLEADGHAGYASHGEDIVCAAISVLMQTAVNSLEAVAGLEYFIYEADESGYMYIELPASMNEAKAHDADVIFRTVLTGLEGIADAYPKHIKLLKREVQTQ